MATEIILFVHWLLSAPSDIESIRTLNPNDTSLQFKWKKPNGFQEKYKVTYFPQVMLLILLQYVLPVLCPRFSNASLAKLERGGHDEF